MRRITSFAHGIIDYSIGFLLIASGLLLRFGRVPETAYTVPILAGLFILGQALITRYELGLFKVLPLRLHLATDVLLGLALLLSPFLFGFSQGFLWTVPVIAGLTLLGGGLMTNPRPGPSWTDFRNNTIENSPSEAGPEQQLIDNDRHRAA